MGSGAGSPPKPPGRPIHPFRRPLVGRWLVGWIAVLVWGVCAVRGLWLMHGLWMIAMHGGVISSRSGD